MNFTRRQMVKAASASAVAVTSAAKVSVGSDALDVAVVGAGVFGSWTAWHLNRLGARVGLYDAYGPGNARSSSGGESRVIRLSYGGDPLYSGMALESLAYWKSLSDRQTPQIFHPVGVLWFSPGQDEYFRRSLSWLSEHNIAHQSGHADWLRRKWPQISFKDFETGFLEEGMGALLSNRAVQATVRDAGIDPVVARVGPPQRSASGGFALPGGRTAKKLVYALGPWLGATFPNLLGGRLNISRQEVFYFGPPKGDHRFAPPDMPVWADFNQGDIVYGLPDIEGRGFKLAFDRHGPTIDPDSLDRTPSSEGIKQARDYIARRFPALADSPLVQSRVCQYTNSSNGDLLIDWHPENGDVLLVGGGSGHGFKHGPAVGRRAAEMVIAEAHQAEPRLSLTTKAKGENREVY